MKHNPIKRSWRHSRRLPATLLAGLLLTEQLWSGVTMGAETIRREETFNGEQVAAVALDNMRRLMVSGDPIYLQRFTAAFNQIPKDNPARAAFVSTFREGVFGENGFFKDPKYGPIFDLYAQKTDPKNRSFNQDAFVKAVLEVHKALQGDADKREEAVSAWKSPVAAGIESVLVLTADNSKAFTGPTLGERLDSKSKPRLDLQRTIFILDNLENTATLNQRPDAGMQAQKVKDYLVTLDSETRAEVLKSLRDGVGTTKPLTFVDAIDNLRRENRTEIESANKEAARVGELFVAFVGEKDQTKQKAAGVAFSSAIDSQSNEWFADAFEHYLKTKQPQYWKVYEEYLKGLKPGQTPSYKDFCDKVIRTTSSLFYLATSVDSSSLADKDRRSRLEQREGAGFVTALDKIVSLSTKVFFNLGREKQNLSERLDGARDFLVANGIMGPNPEDEVEVNPAAKEYLELRRRISEATDEATIISLRKAIPTKDLLQIAKDRIARAGERILVVLSGRTVDRQSDGSVRVNLRGSPVDFFQTLGQTFYTRLAQLDSEARDQMRLNPSPLFQRTTSALLVRVGISGERSSAMSDLITTLRQAHGLMGDKTVVLEQALRESAFGTGSANAVAAAADFKSIENNLDSITEQMAKLLGITDKKQRDELRLEVERRFMAPYIVVEGSAPLTRKNELLDRFVQERTAMANSGQFQQWSNSFSDRIKEYQAAIGSVSLSPEDQRLEATRSSAAEAAYRSTNPLGVSGAMGTGPLAAATYEADSKLSIEERNIRQQQRVIAQQALTLLADPQALPSEYRYAVFQVLNNAYQGSFSSALKRPEEMSKICALIVAFAPRSGFPAAYASRLVTELGDTMLGSKLDYEIIKAGAVAVPAISRFTSGEYYHMAGAMYSQVIRRINRATTRLAAYRVEMRDQGDQYSVLVRLPVDDRAYNLGGTRPFRMTLAVPKSIYARPEFRESYVLERPADIIEAPYGAADPLATLARFIGPMVRIETLLPYPSIRGPILDTALVEAFADFPFPPVGEYLTVLGNLGLTGRAYTAKQTDSTSGGFSANATLNTQREGLTTTAAANYSLDYSDPTQGGRTVHAADFSLRELRNRSGTYHVNQVLADLRVEDEKGTGSTLTNLGVLFSGSAPKGVDTVLYFRRREDIAKTAGSPDSYYEAHILQRAPNGSFFLADTLTLPKAVAQSLYQQTFKDPIQRLYAGFSGRSASGFEVNMDGAVLMSGPNELTAGDGGGALVPKDREEDVISGQGAGALIQSSGGWGGLVDYEHTRGKRAQAAFGSFEQSGRPNRTIWYGRVVLNNISQMTNDAGKGGYYAEFRYLQSNKSEARAFLGYDNGQLSGVGLLNWRWDQPVLGPLRIKHAGLIGGRTYTTSDQGTVDTRGATGFLINQDLLNGLVVSFMRRTTTSKDTGTGSKTTDENLYAAGLRWYFLNKTISLEGGTLWNNSSSTDAPDVNTGAAGLKLEWTVSERTKLGLKGGLIAADGALIPIGVGTLEVHTSRTTVLGLEAGYSFGELQFLTPRLRLIGGGGVLKDYYTENYLSSGGHGGIIYTGQRTRLALLGSYSEHSFLGSDRKTLTSYEGLLLGTYTLTTGNRRWDSVTAFAYASSIYQERNKPTPDLKMPGTETRQAFQTDLGFGAQFTSLTEQLRISLNVIGWSASAAKADGNNGPNLFPDWDKRTAQGRVQLNVVHTSLGTVYVGKLPLYRLNWSASGSVNATETPANRQIDASIRVLFGAGF